MKCIECGSEMIDSHETVRDHLIGLKNVTLVNIMVRHCPKCGESEIEYPRIESLHQLLASTLIKKTSRLTGEEVRFLRKYLGWSSENLAHRLGVDPATVSRWENEKDSIGVVPDRALRLMIATKQPVQDYEIETWLDTLTTGEPKTESMTVEVRGKDYAIVA